MDTAAEILVIILSVFLAIFLLLGIILAIYLIKLSQDIRRITQSAERTVDKIGSAVTNATKLTSPLFIADQISRFIRRYRKTKHEED